MSTTVEESLVVVLFFSGVELDVLLLGDFHEFVPQNVELPLRNIDHLDHPLVFDFQRHLLDKDAVDCVFVVHQTHEEGLSLVFLLQGVF